MHATEDATEKIARIDHFQNIKNLYYTFNSKINKILTSVKTRQNDFFLIKHQQTI